MALRTILKSTCVALAISASAGLLGCQKGPDPAILAQHRERLLMDDEPDDLQTVAELREAFAPLAETDDAENPDVPITPTPPEGPVVLVGRVGGLTNPWGETQPAFPFVKGEASFFLADAGAVAENEASGHNHAPGEECAFCAAHAADNSTLIAMVRFSEKTQTDKPVAIEAKQLFEIAPLDTVVVRGKARLVGDATTGMLVIDADGLYIRR